MTSARRVQPLPRAFGGPIDGEPEVMATENTLGFAGITPPMLRV